MATYATTTDFLDYSEGATAGDPAGLERWLMRAERDIAGEITAYDADPATGLIAAAALDAMPAVQRLALRDATCAQAEYRIGRGDEDREHWRPTSVRGPDFSYTDGQAPLVSPKAVKHLRDGGLRSLLPRLG